MGLCPSCCSEGNDVKDGQRIVMMESQEGDAKHKFWFAVKVAFVGSIGGGHLTPPLHNSLCLALPLSL